MKNHWIVILLLTSIVSVSCKKENKAPAPKLIFKFKFDSTQERLNNIGQPSTIPSGHAAQNPIFNSMSVHYIELTSTAFVALGQGAVLYKAPETTAGGTRAITLEKSTFWAIYENFFFLSLRDV